jgi:DNA-binding transcriptional regulator LsrR (DeoR family)
LTISEERKERVIDLYYNQGKTTREIAKIERMSIRDISAIRKEEEANDRRIKIKSNLPKPTSCFLKVSSLWKWLSH